ncbi:MAG: hypothetical protein VZQ47_11170 [Treponema sp.]|nr:hypothetical protein [Treponema sp.]
MLDNQKFIESSLKNILLECISLTKENCKYLQSYPLLEYLLYSTFLKMTGYSEQKLKCICWDVASLDPTFKYEVYSNWKFGECSNLDAKNGIFAKLIELLKNKNDSFSDNEINTIIPPSIAKENYKWICDQLANSNLQYFDENGFYTFKKSTIYNKVSKLYENEKRLFNNDPNDRKFSFIYKKLYEQRNRNAHNLTSYQQNLPSLRSLQKKTEFENYFHYFTLLIIMDEIYVKLYKQIIKEYKNNW